MIIIDKKNTEQLLKVINMTEFLFIFFQLFSQWEHLKVSPRLNTRTGVQYWRWVQWSQKSHLLHFTTHVLFWSSFVCQSWQKQHFSSSAMLSPSLVSGHSSSDRSGIGPPFLLIPDVLGPSFSMIFFSSLFAGLLDSAAALDTGTFFCCFASMEFRMLMLVFLVKFPDRNGGKNIF